MRKILLLVSILCLSITLCGCGRTPTHWEWEYEDVVSQIKEVHIVDVGSALEYKILKTISKDDYDNLCSDIVALDMYMPKFRFGDPGTPYGKGFLIIFNDGEYDLITRSSPSHVKRILRDGKFVFSPFVSFIKFTHLDEFDALINKYMSIE